MAKMAERNAYEYVIGGSEYVSSKNALYEHNMYLYNLSERIRNDGW